MTLISTDPSKINGRNLRKNREQKIYRINKNLLDLKFLSDKNDP